MCWGLGVLFQNSPKDLGLSNLKILDPSTKMNDPSYKMDDPFYKMDDPSYKMDLDLCDHFGKENPQHIKNRYTIC